MKSATRQTSGIIRAGNSRPGGFAHARRRGSIGASLRAAFTLAEVLAALVFMAIVIPVAIEGLRIAGQAGEVARCKSQAARIAERVLNESTVTTNWSQSLQSGTVTEGEREFRWKLRTETWVEDPMRLLSVEVTYGVQDKQYSLRLNTLVDSTPPGSQPLPRQ